MLLAWLVKSPLLRFLDYLERRPPESAPQIPFAFAIGGKGRDEWAAKARYAAVQAGQAVEMDVPPFVADVPRAKIVS
jgi:hypothetical protein